MSEDLYAILGVDRQSSEKEIARAYRKLAMKYHPDRTQGDTVAEEKFKKINQAYEVLSDKKKKAQYDQYGSTDFSGSGGFGGGSGFEDIFDNIFSDIFGSKGGSSRQSSGQRGSDLQYNIEIDLEDVIRGKKISLNIPNWKNCGDCSGNGSAGGNSINNCSHCGGAGQIRMQQGFFSLQQTCPSCQGAGKVITKKCSSCKGKGRIQIENNLNVKIPAGIGNGEQIRVVGKGETGIGNGPSGDLYVKVHVREHSLFRRDGNDLYCDVPVAFVTATLGGEVTVPTLSGQVKLKIPAETQNGQYFRLKSKGISGLRGGVGDLICLVVVEVPVNLSSEQKSLLEKFDKLCLQNNQETNPKSKSWFDKVKNFFE